MRSQVDDAYAAADRLGGGGEAGAPPRGGGGGAAAGPGAAARRRAGDVPRAGYEGERSAGERSAFGDLQALLGLLEAARTSVPPEVARQLAEARRELLLAVRALIDSWIERLEPVPERPIEVQDIPIA